MFLWNNTSEDSDFFSFALDRPTDYLFDLNYLGRSEASGLFSQQIIIAEGGFKSQLEPEFANQWMTTANVSTSIWRYIQAYGDIGLVKNKYDKAKFVYDSGISSGIGRRLFRNLLSGIFQFGLGNCSRQLRSKNSLHVYRRTSGTFRAVHQKNGINTFLSFLLKKNRLKYIIIIFKCVLLLIIQIYNTI